MRVLVTGAGGFLAGALAVRLRAAGHQVRGTSSSPERARAGGWEVLRFGDPVSPALLEGVEVVVHAAHDLAHGAGPATVAGTIAIAEAARSAGVGHQVLVSSFSAHAGAVTEYGRAKLALEAWFLPRGQAVVRPGLVIGRGGMFARMVEVVRRNRVVPVVYPSGRMAVVGERDCLTCLVHAVEARPGVLLGAWLEQRTSMAELLGATRRALRARTLLVPVPYALALAGARAAEGLGIRAPLGSDSLRAMRANAAVADPGTLGQIVARPLGLEEMIADAIH